MNYDAKLRELDGQIEHHKRVIADLDTQMEVVEAQGKVENINLPDWFLRAKTGKRNAELSLSRLQKEKTEVQRLRKELRVRTLEAEYLKIAGEKLPLQTHLALLELAKERTKEVLSESG